MATYTFPIDINQTLDWKVRNFPDDIYYFNPGDHLTNLMETLLGGSGTGQLSTLQTTARINEQLYGMEYSDLDAILGTLLTVSRTSEEQYDSTIINPFLQQITVEDWKGIIGSDGSYRGRLREALIAVNRGATVLGMKQMAEAISGVPCDIVENWKSTAYSRFEYPSPYEFVVLLKYSNNGQNIVDPEIKSLIYTVLNHLKPVGTICTVYPTWQDPNYLEVTPRTSQADSEWFELERTVIAPTIPPAPPNSNPVISSRYWLIPGQPVPAPQFSHMRTQEASINMTNTVASIQIQVNSITFPTSSAPILSITWGSWISMGLADSPDNFPDGEFPADPSRHTPTGQYIFEFDSQADYVSYKTAIIEALGGQVSGLLYRLPTNTLYEPASQQQLLGMLNPGGPSCQSLVYGGI